MGTLITDATRKYRSGDRETLDLLVGVQILPGENELSLYVVRN
jgi:hypothetical protein